MSAPVLFTRLRRGRSDKPLLRVYADGHISLNRPALALLRVGPEDELVFYWYGDLGQIGLRKALAGDPIGARFRVGKGSGFSLRAFFQLHRVDIERAVGIYPLGIDPKHQLAVATLPREAMPVVVDASGAAARLAAVRERRQA